MAIIQTVAAISALLISFAALLYKPVALRLEVLGLTRPLGKIQNIHGHDFHLIPDTLYCEDLHYHKPSNLLFGASEEKPETRWKWFPPFVDSTILLSKLLFLELQLLRNFALTYTACQYRRARRVTCCGSRHYYCSRSRGIKLLCAYFELHVFGWPDE